MFQTCSWNIGRSFPPPTLFYFLVTSTVTIFESDNCIPLELSNDSNVFEIWTVKRRFPAPGILGSGNETGSMYMYHIAENFWGRKLFANCLCRQQMPHLQIAQRKVLQIVNICESFLPQKFPTVCHLRTSSDPWPDWQPYSQEVVHSVSQNTGSCIIVAWVNVKNRQMCRLQRFNLRVSWASETEQHYLNSEASPVHQITAYRSWMSVASISCSNFNARFLQDTCIPTVLR